MTDPFRNERVSRESPALHAAAVTTHNTNELPVVARALWIGGAGDVSVVPAGQHSPVTIKNVSGVLPVSVKQVRTTGTTATDIVALW